MPGFDTHAHLFDDRFRDDLETVVERSGLSGILAVGIDLATSRESMAQAERFAIVRAAVGIQPNHVHEAQPDHWDQITRLASHPRVAALGETGLDRYWDHAPFPLQEDYFARHLALSRLHSKPVVIHCRDAAADIVRMLKEDYDRHGPVAGVMHSFTTDAATLEACLAMGLYISFAGMITYKNAAELRALIANVPADRLLAETDCPYLAPVPHRGKRCEPAHVMHTIGTIAAARGEELGTTVETTTANAMRFFKLIAG